MKKTVLLLPLMLVALSGGAAAQEVCTNQFSACVGICVKDKSPAFQDKCIEVCQTNNSACYSKHNGLVQQEVVQDRNADDAQASQPPMPRKKPTQRTSQPRAEQRR